MVTVFLEISSHVDGEELLPESPLNIWAKVDVLMPLNRGEEGNSITLDIYNKEGCVGHAIFRFMPEEQHTPVVGNYIRAEVELDELEAEESEYILSDKEKRELLVESMRRCGWIVEEDVGDKVFQRWVFSELMKTAQERLNRI